MKNPEEANRWILATIIGILLGIGGWFFSDYNLIIGLLCGVLSPLFVIIEHSSRNGKLFGLSSLGGLCVFASLYFIGRLVAIESFVYASISWALLALFLWFCYYGKTLFHFTIHNTYPHKTE